MKNYTVQVTTAEKPYNHYKVVSANDELDAIDKVAEYYTIKLDKEIVDIKVV